MPTVEQKEHHQSIEKHKRETLNAVVGEHVIHTLGKPDSLRKVQVRRLWGDYYRVNILIGADASSVSIANSYFVMADGEGNIIEARPKIKKQY
jgi:hypothetical protein